MIGAHAGRPGACIAWDLDGTLFDPRPRMLRSVHAFGHSEVRLADVDVSWQKTADRLGLDPIAFQEAWHETFWTTEAILSDVPIADTVWTMRWAAWLGIAPVFVTGRVEELRGATLSQLRRHGVAMPRLVMKGDTDDDTCLFKARAIADLVATGGPDAVVAFVTDSRREIDAVRRALPSLPCVLVLALGDDHDSDDDDDDDDVPRWQIDPEPWAAGEHPVLPMGLPMTPWMVQEVARELAARDRPAHDEGAERDFSPIAVLQPIMTRSQCHTRWVTDSTSAADVDEAVGRITRLGCEHQLNDKEGLVRSHTGNLQAAFQAGNPFDLPFFAIGAIDVVRSRHFPVDKSIELLFHDDDHGQPAGPWMLPMHPQGQTRPAGRWLRQVRATSSARTVVVGAVGGTPMALKCHAPHLVLDRHPRALSARDASHGVRVSDALYELGTVCFFPEVLAVTDASLDIGCVVRRWRPWPDGAARTVALPAYCLWSMPTACDGGPPLIVRLRDRHGDDVVVDRLLRPLIDLALHLAIDLGCAFMGHGQNVHVEFDDDGAPTGRVVLADLEDVWPHPVITKALALPFTIDDAYVAEHRDSPESHIANAFQDHFIWRLLHPLLHAVEMLRPASNLLLREGVIARVAQVRRFSPGPLSWFAETFLD